MILSPQQRVIPMERTGQGYWRAFADNCYPGTQYLFSLDKKIERPDPASHFQTEGVHGPSQVIDHQQFVWEDGGWQGIPLQDLIIYELHIGTFTPQGTFDSAVARLEELQDLGINALNVMPVAQFPGDRNWGYDGAYPFAVQNSYGGPEGLKRLVNACHKRGMSVILDVVYNHLGPEGNYLSDYGPYFTEEYKTPWGKGFNFDHPYSDEVRNFFIQNALFWFGHYHLDALRLDAVHAIFDMSAKPFLQELAEEMEAFSKEHRRKLFLTAESDLNDVKLLKGREQGGYGLDAQWNDDFHHALHSLLTRENSGYYSDFGGVGDLVKAIKQGYVLDWRYSLYRKRHHGSSSREVPSHRFVVFAQNHDQVGNRLRGERLSRLVPFEALKLAAGVVLLAPSVPLLFMGEEYGEESPFLFFVSYGDPNLIAAVREGRKREFETFRWQQSPPDPQDPATFRQSGLKWEKRTLVKHKTLLEFYKSLIALRKTIPALSRLNKENLRAVEMPERILALERWWEGSRVLSIMNFDQEPADIVFNEFQGRWRKRLDSADRKWQGPGAFLPDRIKGETALKIMPYSLSLFEREA